MSRIVYWVYQKISKDIKLSYHIQFPELFIGGTSFSQIGYIFPMASRKVMPQRATGSMASTISRPSKMMPQTMCQDVLYIMPYHATNPHDINDISWYIMIYAQHTHNICTTLLAKQGVAGTTISTVLQALLLLPCQHWLWGLECGGLSVECWVMLSECAAHLPQLLFKWNAHGHKSYSIQSSWLQCKMARKSIPGTIPSWL